ncbi:hypothetical protein ACTA71_008332 [Dictyostelium dimigraforme]
MFNFSIDFLVNLYLNNIHLMNNSSKKGSLYFCREYSNRIIEQVLRNLNYNFDKNFNISPTTPPISQSPSPPTPQQTTTPQHTTSPPTPQQITTPPTPQQTTTPPTPHTTSPPTPQQTTSSSTPQQTTTSTRNTHTNNTFDNDTNITNLINIDPNNSDCPSVDEGFLNIQTQHQQLSLMVIIIIPPINLSKNQLKISTNLLH